MSVKKVKLDIDTACHHHVDKKNEQLKKKDKDALEWKIKNNCPSDQEVLFCVYDAETGNLVNPPFDPCISEPPGLKIGTTFVVKSRKKAKLKCTGKDEGKYRKLVLTGTDVPSEGCPPQEPLIETHRLGVEIIP